MQACLLLSLEPQGKGGRTVVGDGEVKKGLRGIEGIESAGFRDKLYVREYSMEDVRSQE